MQSKKKGTFAQCNLKYNLTRVWTRLLLPLSLSRSLSLSLSLIWYSLLLIANVISPPPCNSHPVLTDTDAHPSTPVSQMAPYSCGFWSKVEPYIGTTVQFETQTSC